MTNISIPSSVASIGDWAFALTGLVTIFNYRELSQSISDGMFDGAYYATLNVPTVCTAAYRAAQVWKDFTNIQEFDVQGVEPSHGIFIVRVAGVTKKVAL